MKKTPTRELEEGPAAFDRFRKAVKTIIGVHKTDVVGERPRRHTKKRKPASHKG